MSSSEVLIRVGNVRTQIEVTMQKEDLPGSPGTFIPFNLTQEDGNSTIEAKRDDETIISLVANVKNPPGTDGILQHLDATGIFDVEGTWYFRGIATLNDGTIMKGSWEKRIIGK